MEASFKVKLFTISKGLEILENIKVIRIKSKEYNLLLMPGYTSVLGEIEGTIEFEDENKKHEFNDISAYYVNSNDEFSLLIKEI